MKTMQTTCNYCSLACNFNVTTENGEITNIVPVKDYPANKGFACIKGLFLNKQLSKFCDPVQPRIKNVQGNFKLVSRNETYQNVAQRLLEIKNKYGSDAIAGISIGQMALFGHIMRTFPKGHMDGNTRPCMATAVVAHKQSFGLDAPGYTLKDFELSDTIIFIGVNPIVAHPVIWTRVHLNTKKKVIVIDPRRSETAMKANYHYQIKPKSDLYLYYTLANILIEKGWTDQNYINNHTEGFNDFKEFVKEFTLEKAPEATGLSREQILELAQLIHDGEAVSFWWTTGVNQDYKAVRTAQAIINLALMTGNIGRACTGANSITGQCNATGSRLFSNTTGLYGGGDFDNQARREAVGKAPDSDSFHLPLKPTLPYNAIIEKVNAGEIKTLWIVATNLCHSQTNNEESQKAIENLELFIVQDLYGDTDSSKHADVFFPITPGLCKDSLMINTECCLSRLQPIISSDGRPSDFTVSYKVGEAIGMGDLLEGWTTPKSAFNSLKECTRGMLCDITGVDYDTLKDSKRVQRPYPEGANISGDGRRLFVDSKFYTPSNKAKFIFENPLTNPVFPSLQFPHILNTGRGTVGQWHTQTRTREILRAKDMTIEQAYIYINEELAKEKGIAHQEQEKVSSINGQSNVFTALYSKNVPYNQLYAPLHFETNKLMSSVYDPYSKEPSYKTTPTQIYTIL